MAGIRCFYFRCLFYVWRKGMAILCSPLSFYSLFGFGVGYWLFLRLPDLGRTRSFKRKVCCVYSKPDDVLALHRDAQSQEKHKWTIHWHCILQTDRHTRTYANLWFGICLRFIFGIELFYRRPY